MMMGTITLCLLLSTGSAGVAQAKKLLILPTDLGTDALRQTKQFETALRQSLEELKTLTGLSIYDDPAINARFEIEKRKDAAGCSEANCLAEIVGAYDAPYALHATIQRGNSGQWLIGLRLLVRGSRRTGYETTYETLELASGKSFTQQVSAFSGALRRLFAAAELEMFTRRQGPRSTNLAVVVIRSTPSNARIHVNGEYVGTTPNAIDLSTGTQLLRLELDGYAETTQEIEVRAGAKNEINVRLSILRGNAYINSKPPNATCYVDGRLYKKTPCDIRGLEVGKHNVVLKRPFYEDLEQTILVTPDPTANMHTFKLVPRPMKVFIDTVPDDVRFEVDDGPSGKSDAVIKLRPGKHKVRLFKEGYEDADETLEVEVGKAATLNYVMQKGLSERETIAARKRSLWGWLTAGLSAAALGVGIWQGLEARSQQNKVKDTQAGTDEAASLKSDGEAAARNADISFGVAALSAAASGYIWFVAEF